MLRNKLHKRERCPIHNSYFCCGREEFRAERFAQKKQHRPMRKPGTGRWYQVAPGVCRIDDTHHPRGFREKRNSKAMHDLINKKIIAQEGICPLCESQMEHYFDITDDHIEIRGMGGANRDDHPDNIQVVHVAGNNARGSMSLELYLQKPLEERRRNCGVGEQRG